MAEGRGTRGRRPTETQIVNATLALATEVGWDGVRLHAVADRLGAGLADVCRTCPDLDAVANSWFRRARDAVLATPEDAVAGLPAAERLEAATLRWFDTLAPHRKLTGKMLGGKLYASHPHHWVPMIFDLSRLIHVILDAARIRSTGRARQIAEIGMTSIFLATLGVWLTDGSPDQQRTRAFLHERLAEADRLMSLLRAG